MIDHFGINCADLDAATTFYDTVLATLGHTRLKEFSDDQGHGAIGYGTTKPDFWISRFSDDLGPNREMHLAFSAPDAATVRAFVEAAVGLGAEVLHEPRHFPEYHDHYYGGFVRDPDGNNVEAVCHRVAPE
ncbi:VOC family protein [Nocardioides marmoriginsengisoli]|uniref:VOC family protein n=1 Tax=Nocardioides marmoriginsengisoli TaxID=661483 RepID=A0A3N0CH38_9ACTN|nr:VOC family protein [Nocardioides marmoriginsengisoli]RNL62571.1 VOC family protein [Nocardioides marmoriginsengisoli]